MGIFAAVPILLAAAGVQIGLAPDQPLPYVYLDDPLIIAFESDQRGTANAELVIEPRHQAEPFRTSSGPLLLRPHGERWWAIEGLPPERGCYTAHVKLTLEGVETDYSAPFCRVDRPVEVPALPVGAAYPDALGLLALDAAGIRILHLDAADPQVTEGLVEAGERGFQVVLRLDPDTVEAPAKRAAELAQVAGAVLLHIELASPSKAGLWTDVLRLLKEAGCSVPVLPAIHKEETFLDLLDMAPGKAAQSTVLRGDLATPEVIARLRTMAGERAFESWDFLVELSLRSGTPGSRVAVGVLDLFVSGARHVEVSPTLVYDGGLHEPLVYFSGLAQRLPGRTYAGELDLGEGVRAPVFRKGGTWMLGLSAQDSARDVEFDLGDARDVLLTDARGNPRTLPEGDDGTLAFTIDEAPLYLTGIGGAVPAAAARTLAGECAATLLENALFLRYLPDALPGLVKNVVKDLGGTASRNHFLNLVRDLPTIERQWHSGKIPKNVAVAATAQIVRLARCLCAIEQERGDPFLEPLQETLVRCREYQTVYLTKPGSTPLARLRGPWLLKEVRALAAEAEALQAAGLPIEASALATLAEWRARSLEHAAQAGFLSQKTSADKEKPKPAEEAEPVQEPSEAKEEPAAPSEEGPPEEDKKEEAAEAPEPTPPPEPPKPPEPKKTVHTVAQGDNPSKIAGKYGVEVDKLLEWNKLTRHSMLSIGDKLVVWLEPPPEPEAPEPPATKEIVHKVVRGDNPSVIAHKYGVDLDDLMKWNKLTRRSVLNIGDKIVVQVKN